MLDICNQYAQKYPDISRRFCEKAISSAFAKENISFRARAFIDFGFNLNKQGRIDEAISFLEEGLSLAVTNLDQKNEMHAYRCLGIYYNDRGDNVLATDYYIKSLQLATLLKDTLGMIKPYVNLTGIYIDQNRPEKSIEYGLNGLKLARAFKDKRGEGFLLNNLAMAYLTQDKPAQAKDYLQAALEINLKRGEPERIARNHSNLCNTYRMLGDMALAQYHCAEAQRILESLNNPRSLMMHAVTYGQYYLDGGQTDKALQKANEALSYGENASLSIHMADAYDLLHKIYKVRGDYKQALDMYEKCWDIKFGGINNERNAQIAASESNFIKLVDEKEKLEKQAQIAELQSQSIISSRRRNVAFVLAAFLGLVGISLYVRSLEKNRINKRLTIQNEKIEYQNAIITETLAEKELLLKEIHHRVKNNLQIVSSLLNLQSKKIQNEDVLSSIEEGKNRVEAMSLIHQNLYQRDTVSTINMKSYLAQLTDNLSRSFDMKRKNISLKVLVDEINFDIDTAVPIGLIINELISNAYKHAFGDTEEGLITVAIEPIDDPHYFKLIVKDNGKGISEEIKNKKSKSLGLKLVNTLGVRQLKGNLQIINDGGTLITLIFKELKKEIAA